MSNNDNVLNRQTHEGIPVSTPRNLTIRLLRTVHYCVLSIILKIYLQPQYCAVNPVAVLPLFLRPRLFLPFIHLSPIAGIRGAAAGICRPRWSPPVCLFLLVLRWPSNNVQHDDLQRWSLIKHPKENHGKPKHQENLCTKFDSFL